MAGDLEKQNQSSQQNDGLKLYCLSVIHFLDLTKTKRNIGTLKMMWGVIELCRLEHVEVLVNDRHAISEVEHVNMKTNEVS